MNVVNVMWSFTVLGFIASLVGAVVSWHVTRDICAMQARLRDGVRHNDALLIASWRDMTPFKRDMVRRSDPQTADYIARVMWARKPQPVRRPMADAAQVTMHGDVRFN